MSEVRTRFAPSPTGYMHIGGMRTALFNWLWARHNQGRFILRIDDTDQQRNIEEALQPILDAFRWLGLDWDEGPDVDGPHGPYFQSQRSAVYDSAISRLLESGKAYRDFDSPEQIQADRKEAETARRNYLNIRRSLDLSEAEIADRTAAGDAHTIRLLVPRDEQVTIEDAVRGQVEWDCGLVSDPVLVRGNGRPLYNFATVVDDLDLEISHVIRGEEHLTNTAVQVMIYNALGGNLPKFAHIPFITAPGTSRKLSKRDLAKYRNNPQFRRMFDRADQLFPRLGLGDSEQLNPVMVEYYQQLGYLPEAILNALSRLGWSLDDQTEVMSNEFVIQNFSLDRIVKSAAGFDTDKLASFQLHWMNQLDLAQKIDGTIPYLERAGLLSRPVSGEVREYLGRVVTAMGDRLKVFSDILDVDYFFLDTIQRDPKALRKRVAKETVPELLSEYAHQLEAIKDWTADSLEQSLQEFCAEKEISAGLMIHALRISATGQPNGPGVYECLELVGQKRVVERIPLAIAEATKSAKPS